MTQQIYLFENLKLNIEIPLRIKRELTAGMYNDMDASQRHFAKSKTLDTKGLLSLIHI